ncbi:MAG TPA: MFS transporter [Stellaceae bacterium]|jgi:ACS family tartrate transporter-like MFS transporter|nr:MFS transporter [Stellaceae bacterium]
MVAQSDVAGGSDTLSRPVVSKLFWRIIPLLLLIVMLNYIDRSNLGFAALQMNSQLGFSPAVYGTGASIFFIGYVCAQIPATLLIHKFGAGRTIACIMVTWGLIAAAMALISDTTSFYTLRFLLAVAEAGMIPGATLYISQWFPQSERGRAVGTLYTATAAAVVIGGPLSGALLEMPAWLGLKPWQWMFILEAAPTIILGFFVRRILTDDPSRASWLDERERNELVTTLAQEQRNVGAMSVSGGWTVLANWRVWVLFVAYICIGAQFLSMVLWLPQIIRHLQNLSPFQIGLVTAIPYLVSVVLMYYVGQHSDRTGKRSPYVIAGLIIGAAGCATSAYLTASPVLSLVALIVGISGVNPLVGPFWSFATGFLRGSAAAVGIAILSCGGSIGGFLATFLLGIFREKFGSFEMGLYFMAGIAVFGAVLMWLVARNQEAKLLGQAQATAT